MKLYNTSVSIEMVKNYEYKYIHKDKYELSQNYITGSQHNPDPVTMLVTKVSKKLPHTIYQGTCDWLYNVHDETIHTKTQAREDIPRKKHCAISF